MRDEPVASGGGPRAAQRRTLTREVAEADAALGVDLYGVLGADAEDLVFSPASRAAAGTLTRESRRG